MLFGHYIYSFLYIARFINTNNFSKNNQTTSNETNGNTVYRTPSGKKYHLSSTCGGKNSYEVSYDDAISSGLTPCKKCVK